MNKAFNKADLSGAVVVGKALLYPRRVNVLIGDDNNGYERGDLADANAIIDIVSYSIDHSDHKELKPIKEALLKETLNRMVEDISLAKSILNATVDITKSTLPDGYVYTVKQGDRTVGIINVSNVESASTINAGTNRTEITGKPTGYMYYDTLLNTVTVYDNGVWKDCDGNLII